MKTKTIMAVSAAVALTACTSGVLWTSAITDAELTAPPLPVTTDSTSNSYQLYPVGTQLYLRKLDTKGVVLWQQIVDDTLTDSISEPILQATANGVAVAYQDATSKQAFLKQFDSNGLALWSTDFGTHTAEAPRELVADSDSSLTVALKLTNTRTNVLRYDSTGALQWETAIPACSLRCAASLGVNANGDTLVNNSEAFATKSYLLDSTGAQLWTTSRSTGIAATGIVPNAITPTATGFVSIHPFVTWEYDLAGNQTWSQSLGAYANVALDASGNLFIPHGTTISKFAADGTTLLSEIALSGQTSIRQVEWREDLQRLIVLANYAVTGPELDATITTEYGMTLFVYDATGVKKASYKSTTTLEKTPVPIPTCTPLPKCAITTTPGEVWQKFATTPDKKIVVSGAIESSTRFAKAYKLP